MLLVETALAPVLAMDPDHHFPPDLNYANEQQQQQQQQQQQWMNSQQHSYYAHNSSHSQEFPGYSFAPSPSSMPPHPYAAAAHGQFHPNQQQQPQQPQPQQQQQQHRAHHSQLQSLMMPPHWPGLVPSQPSTPVYPGAMHRGPEGMAQPQLPSHHPQQSTHAQPTPRRTLTDMDRRRMCLYHEEHPHKKQTEIGEIFGVERSTVSKVLRQKEKYLALDDGGRSPIKRVRPKIPDLERTLAKWVQNQKEKGTLLTDEAIKNQARTFLAASGATPDGTLQIESSSWLEKFKLKNNIKQSKGSHKDVSEDAQGDAMSPSLSASVSDPNLAATSGRIPSPGSIEMIKHNRSFESRESLQRARPSNASLSSAFTEHAGNPSSGSPIFSPEAAGNPSTYFPGSGMAPTSASRSANLGMGSDLHRRPCGLGPDYLSSPSNTLESHTPTYNSVAVSLESPLSDMPPPALHHFGSSGQLARQASGRRDSRFSGSASPSMVPQTVGHPTITDARLGLETAMNFLQQNADPLIESGDLFAMNRIMDKLRVRQRSLGDASQDNEHELPGRLHRIAEVSYDGQTDQ